MVLKLGAEKAGMVWQLRCKRVPCAYAFLEVQGAHTAPVNFRNVPGNSPLFNDFAQSTNSLIHCRNFMSVNDIAEIHLRIFQQINIIQTDRPRSDTYLVFPQHLRRHETYASNRNIADFVNRIAFHKQARVRRPNWRYRRRVRV